MQKNTIELVGILVIGILQPVVELLMGAQYATYYNGIAIMAVLLYVTVRIAQEGKGLFFRWGFRVDTMKVSIFPYTVFILVSSCLLYVYGWYQGFTPLPVGFWYVLALYPLWGLAQQFVLQNFVANNLIEFFPARSIRSAVTAVIFAGAHIPSVELVCVTLVGGFALTYMHAKYQNLLTLSVAHGVLGALVFHLVLGQDQWKILAEYFSMAGDERFYGFHLLSLL